MKPTIEQDEMFPEGVIPPNWEMEEVYSIFLYSILADVKNPVHEIPIKFIYHMKASVKYVTNMRNLANMENFDYKLST